MEEEWKPVKNYEELYGISNRGRVWSLRRELILAQSRNVQSGYNQVHLWFNSKRKILYVHRMVAAAFVEKPKGCDTVDHIDRDKTNNVAENLRWVTLLQNMANREFKLRPRLCEHCGMPIRRYTSIDGTEARLDSP